MSDKQRRRYLDQLGLEDPITIPQNPDLDRAHIISDHRLQPGTVAGAATTTANKIILVTAQMLVEFLIKDGFDDPNSQHLQQAIKTHQNDTGIPCPGAPSTQPLHTEP